MTVHFIGAGPGAPDLLTLRGRDLIARCPVCLYAGSLVPEQLLEHCPPAAKVINTAPLSLDEIIEHIAAAHAAGQDVARLHSGDLSLWSAMGEQLRRLRDLDIPYAITPGVPSFAAAAASLGQELTLPGVAQSVVLTRTPGRASAMPDNETLANFARSGTTLALHLSIHALSRVVEDLLPFYGADCPVAIVWRASWPDERVIRARLSTVEAALEPEMNRTALILVGPVLAAEDFDESCLYALGYDRRFRPQSAASPFADTAPEMLQNDSAEPGKGQ
ncbi:precorrin-4 C(11)-methyltransferase [Halomonas cupida]|uniref:precorrin-4 C(11)-methyltransferase n=1 Tax=Halomonas cupida TaxID=44933 RepID=UPI003A947B97